MEVRASFLSLCAHSFVWWLLTNVLGAALVYVRFLLLASKAPPASASDQISLVFISITIPYLIATYLTLLWPVFALLPQWWALAAQQQQARRGRLLLVVLGPFTLLAAYYNLRLNCEALAFMGCYLGASLVSAAWMFRQWLR
jgi:hypothetical protein